MTGKIASLASAPFGYPFVTLIRNDKGKRNDKQAHNAVKITN